MFSTEATGNGDLYGQRLQEQSFKSWGTQKIKTRRRSSISCKRSWGLQQDTQHFQRKHWRQMCCCGECSCLRQWKQPVHLGPNYFGEPGGLQEHELRGNSELGQYHAETDIRSILKKFWMWVRLKVPLFHGRDRRCLLIKWSSGQERKYVFTQIPYYVLRRCMMTEMHYKMGRSSGIQNVRFLPRIVGNRWITHWTRGIFSQDFRHCRFFRKTQTDSRERNIELEKFTDRIIFMSMFNDIDWTRKGHDGICVSNWEKVKGWAKRFSQGHWTFVGPGDEKKWYGTLLYTSEGKWDSTATQMVERFKDTRHPVFKSISALSRGIMKKKHNRHHTLQCGCFKHRAFVPNRSFCKSAPYFTEQFRIGVNNCGLTEEEKGREKQKESVTKGVLTSVKSQEVKLLVSSPRQVSGNSLWEIIQDFESLSETVRFTRVCEDASFRHRVSAGMSYKTRPDEDDGLGHVIPLCRHFTFSRLNTQSRAFAAIPGGTVFGPVIEVQILKIFDQKKSIIQRDKTDILWFVDLQRKESVRGWNSNS